MLEIVSNFVQQTPPVRILQGKNTKLSEESNISHWTKIEFPEDYRHSVNILYPSDWDTETAIDTGSFSAHYIYQKSLASIVDENQRIAPKGPVIAIYDFALAGCPNGDVAFLDCGIENVRNMTAEEYMKNLINDLGEKGEVVEFNSLKKIDSVTLNNFANDVPIYQGVSRSGEPVDLYILQPVNGVVGVVFQQPDAFDSNFRTEFFNRLTSN